MCVMTFQATLSHGLVNGSRLLYPVGEDYMAVQTHCVRFLTKQFRLVRNVCRVTPQAPSICNRFVDHLSLDCLCMTLLAQCPRSLRTQMRARLPAVGIVAFKTGLFRHWLMRILTRFKLVTKKAETASFTGQLECVLYCVTLPMASGAGTRPHRPMQNRIGSHVRMATTRRAILRRRGWTLLGPCLSTCKGKPEKGDKNKNYAGNQ